MPKRDTAKFLQKVTAELDRRGYRMVRSLRDVGLCQWLLVRRQKTGELVEVECYDKSITNIMLLIGYRNKIASCGDRYASELFRLPVDQAETDRLVYFVRPYIEGEPLHHLLRRPGGVPPARIRRITVALCKALRVVLAVDPRAMHQVFSNLYLAKDGTIYIDSLCIGPWITVSEADRLLKPLTVEKDLPTAAAQAFACGLAARLYTGVSEPDRERLLNAAESVSGADASLLRRLADEPGSRFWPDAYFDRGRRFLAPRYIPHALVVLLLGWGVWQSEHGNGSPVEWLGEVGLMNPKAPAVVREGGATARPPSSKIVVGPETARQLSDAAALSRDGRFREALDKLETLRKAEGISDDEYVLIVSARSKVEEEMDDEFRYIRARVDKLRRARNYAEALELLEFVPKAYPSGKYTEEASGLVALMMGERRQGIQDQLIEEKEQRDVLAQDLDAFAVLLPRRERYADPTLAVDFDRLADTAETKEIKQACAILADVQEAEIRLLRRIPEHWRKTNSPALLEACGKGLDNKGQRVRDISAKELTIISDATVKRIQWKSLTPAQLYAIFRAAEGEFVKTVPTYSYELYLFCLGRALPSFADELMRLNDTQFEDSAAEAAELPKLLKAIMELEKK